MWQMWPDVHKYDLMKCHSHSGGQVEKETKGKPEAKVTKERPDATVTKEKNQMEGD